LFARSFSAVFVSVGTKDALSVHCRGREGSSSQHFVSLVIDPEIPMGNMWSFDSIWSGTTFTYPPFVGTIVKPFLFDCSRDNITVGSKMKLVQLLIRFRRKQMEMIIFERKALFLRKRKGN
jgi:hypothetical protein